MIQERRVLSVDETETLETSSSVLKLLKVLLR